MPMTVAGESQTARFHAKRVVSLSLVQKYGGEREG